MSEYLIEVQTSQGLAKVRHFKAHEFQKLSKEAAALAAADPLQYGSMEALFMNVLAGLTTIDGRTITIADLDEMYEDEITKLTEALSPAAKIDNRENGIITGSLPSGCQFEMELPKGKHMRRAGELGEDEKPFHFVALTTKIDGNPISHHDVRLWDGRDFIAIKNIGGEVPKN